MPACSAASSTSTRTCSVWLVNTGWTGGPFGEGRRMPIAATRALLKAAITNELDAVDYRVDPVFGFEVPLEVPGVGSELLDPRSTWRDPDAYDRKARELAEMFTANFERFDAPRDCRSRAAAVARSSPQRVR